MGATPSNWRVKLRAGDRLSVAATYDVGRADWYEVMGIMPVAVYDGTDVGGQDAMSNEHPEQEVLTHGHLDENEITAATRWPAGPEDLPSAPTPPEPITINQYAYEQGDLYAPAREGPAEVPPGQADLPQPRPASGDPERLPHDHGLQGAL